METSKYLIKARHLIDDNNYIDQWTAKVNVTLFNISIFVAFQISVILLQ